MTRPDIISATDLAALLEADAAPSIIDVLPADHWRRCRLPRHCCCAAAMLTIGRQEGHRRRLNRVLPDFRPDAASTTSDMA